MNASCDVVFISDADIFAGAEVALAAVAAALARRGYRIAVAFSGRSPRLSSHMARLEEVGVHLVTSSAPLGTPRLGFLSPALRLRQAHRAASLLRSSPSRWVVVNLPTVERGAAVADAVLRMTPRPRLAGYLHLSQPPSAIGARRLVRVRDAAWRQHLSRFDAFLAVARSIADQAARTIGRPVFTVYPASEAVTGAATLRRAEARARLGLGDETVVGLVGRVEYFQKGHDTAVAVALRLRQAGVRTHWVIIGDGPDLERLKVLVTESELSDYFHFAGWQSDMPTLYRALDALLLPSRFEGLPLTAVEACAAGVPVVGYAVDGLAEVLPAEFAVAHGDVHALTSALRQVLEHPGSWPEARQRALARALCDPDAVAARMAAALDLEPCR